MLKMNALTILDNFECKAYLQSYNNLGFLDKMLNRHINFLNCYSASNEFPETLTTQEKRHKA